MKKLFTIILFLSIVGLTNCLFAQEKGKDIVQRTPKGFWDLQQSTTSNFQFYTTNFGIFGWNLEHNFGNFHGSVWPRGSDNQYIFGSGFWFGAQKKRTYSEYIYKYVEVGYNPNNGRSWFTPGRISEGDSTDESKIYPYRVYFSTDMNQSSGQPLDVEDSTSWSLWGTQSVDYPWMFEPNNYEHDFNKRNLNEHPDGPLFISDEDIFCTYKDTDLDNFDGGYGFRKNLGYPLGLQVDQRILTWNSQHPLKDCAVIQYLITNYSTDTLKDCYFGKVLDIDLSHYPSIQAGASNDHQRFYQSEPNLNLGIAWSDTNESEAGNNFGYMGIALIETPAVDDFKFQRKDKIYYQLEEQIGVTTFRNWPIHQDINDDEGRYNYLNSLVKDDDSGPGDWRMLIATGPFHLRPNETVRISVLIAFAMPCKGGEADGTDEDINCGLGIVRNGKNDIPAETEEGLIAKVKNAQKYYYDWNSSAEEIIAKDNKIDIAPNPASNIIDIYLPESIKSDGIQIFNIYGERVINQTITTMAPTQSVSISTLSTGVYFVRVGNKCLSFVKI